MSQIAQLREAASQLSSPERAELAAFLLGGLDEPGHRVEDEEVMRRRDELESGVIKGLTLAEFRKECGR